MLTADGFGEALAMLLTGGAPARARAVPTPATAGYARLEDRDWTVTEAGAALCALTGADREALRGRGLAALVHPDDLPHSRPSGTGAFTLRYRLRCADGRFGMVEDRGERMRFRDGTEGSIGVIDRVATEALAAEDLAVVLDRLHTAVRAGGGWMWAQDAECRFVRLDPVVLRALGFERDPFCGRRHWEMPLEGVEPEALAEHQRRVAAREPYTDFRFWLSDPGGNRHLMSVSGVPVADAGGRFVGYLGVGCTLTDLASATASASRGEQRIAAFAELSPGWFWEQDAEFRFSRFWGLSNDKAHISPQQTLGRRRWELPLQGLSREQLAAHRALVERHAPFRDFEYMLRAEDGLEDWYAVSGRPLYDDEGRFAGYCGTGWRITPMRRLERANARYRQVLDAATEVVRGFAEQRGVQSVLEAIVRRAEVLAGTTSGFAYLVTDRGDRLELGVATGLVTGFAGVHLAPGEGLSGIVWQTGRPLVVNQYRTWAWRSPQYRDSGISAIAGVPLVVDGRVIGVLGVVKGDDGTFDDGVIESIEAFAPLAALTLGYSREAARGRPAPRAPG